MNRIVLVLLTTLATTGAAAAQAPIPLVLTGEALPDGSRVTDIGAVHVDQYGDWVIETTTDAAQDASVVLRSSGPWKQLGDAVSEPAGATIAAYHSFSTELFGGVAWVARLDGTPGGSADDEAVYFEDALWLQEGPVLSWPGTNLPAGSTWLSFDDVRCSPVGGGVLVRGHCDDPTIPGADETFLALGSLCGSIGVLCGVDRLVTDHQPAPGLDVPVESVRLTPPSAAIAPNGGFVVWSCDLRADETTDGCVYRYSGSFAQQVLLAREGSASPVPGLAWGPLEDPAVDVNSDGDWTLRARLDDGDPTTDEVLVQSGAVLAREGDALPGVAPAVLTGFGRGPALIDEGGRVLWYARLSEAGGSSEALFLDEQVLVRSGVTTIAGRKLVAIDGRADAMSISPQGELLVFTGTLSNGLTGAFALDLGGL